MTVLFYGTTQFSGAVVSYNASSRKVTAKDFIQDNLLAVSLIVGISISVSYTHLDVYKRQEHTLANEIEVPHEILRK